MKDLFTACRIRNTISPILIVSLIAGCAVTPPPDATLPATDAEKGRFPNSVGYTDGAEFSFEETVAPGISHTFRSESEQPVTMNIVVVDTSREDLSIETESAEDRLRVRETVPQFVERNWSEDSRPLVAINGGFWARESLPVGMFVDEGIIWQGPWMGRGDDLGKTRSIYAFDDQGNHYTGLPDLEVYLRKPGEEGGVLIDRVNFHENASYGTAYTWPYGNETAPIRENQTQIVLELTSGTWLPNQPEDVTVLRVDDGPTAELDKFKVVIHADNPIPEWVEPGAKLVLDASLKNLPGTVVGAVTGIPRILDNGVVDPVKFAEEEGIREAFVTDLHPRTAVGIKEDGKTVVFVVVDGRQPLKSMGINLIDLGNLMKDLGCVDAINLDGGGSSTMVVGRELVNFPSDLGGPRAVGTAVLVNRTAPLGELASLSISPDGVLIPTGGSVSLTSSGRDAAGEAIDLDQEVSYWLNPEGLAAFRDGRLLALKPGDLEITARTTEKPVVEGTATLTIAEPERVGFDPDALLIEPNSSTEVILDAESADGRRFYHNVVVEDLEIPEFLRYDQTSRRLSAVSEGSGQLIARLGDAPPAILPVSAGIYDEKVFYTFDSLPDEDMSSWMDLLNADESGCSVTLDTARKKEGAASWKFSYKMAHGGTTKIGLPFDVPIEGEPIEVGVWVWGDGQTQWMRGDFRDATGTLFQVDFTTAQQGIDWNDEWRFVRASLEKAKSFTPGAGLPEPPYRFNSIYIVQPQEAAKRDGTIWLDGLAGIDIPEEIKR